MKNKFKALSTWLGLATFLLVSSILLYSFTKSVGIQYYESYTMETSSFSVPVNGSPMDLTEIDKVSCQLKTEQTQYEFSIYGQNSFEMTHTTLGSPNVQSMGSGQVMTIKSNQNSVTGYDANGSVVRQSAQDPEMVDNVNKTLEMIQITQNQSGNFDLKSFLSAVNQAGIAIIEQNADYILLKMDYPSGISEEFGIDAKAGSKISSKQSMNGQLFLHASYEYDQSPQPKLLVENKVYFETSSATGIKMKKFVTTKYSNRKEEINTK